MTNLVAPTPLKQRRPPHLTRWLLCIIAAGAIVYPLSVGPALWMVTRTDDEEWRQVFFNVYYPVGSVLVELPRFIQPPIEWYLGVGAPEGCKPFFWTRGAAYGITWTRPDYGYTFVSK